MEPIFEQQDTELPSQLLTRRFNYHLQMLENFELGTEKSEHHDKMVDFVCCLGGMYWLMIGRLQMSLRESRERPVYS